MIAQHLSHQSRKRSSTHLRVVRDTLCERALALLPSGLRQQLSDADRSTLLETFHRLEEGAEELSYLPVFGYLSLRSDNYRELGKKSQKDVVEGLDFESAVLPNHGLDFVVSTVYRGTPEHPGVVAGLSSRNGIDTTGVLLRIPKCPRCVAEILKREFFAESDLKDSNGTSNSMYRPYLKRVETEDGRSQQALIFLTNADGAKAISYRQKLTPALLGWLMAGHGGFRTKGGDGAIRGGSCWDYWNNSYLQPRLKNGEPVDSLVVKAMELSQRPSDVQKVDSLVSDLAQLQKPIEEQQVIRIGRQRNSGNGGKLTIKPRR